MNKQLVVLTAVLALTTGYVMADEPTEVATETAVQATVEVGNTICPLTGRELNLADPNDFTKMDVEGLTFNVCPKGKSEFDKDPTPFADKVAAAVAAAKAQPASVDVTEPVMDMPAETMDMPAETMDMPTESTEEAPVENMEAPAAK